MQALLADLIFFLVKGSGASSAVASPKRMLPNFS